MFYQRESLHGICRDCTTARLGIHFFKILNLRPKHGNEFIHLSVSSSKAFRLSLYNSPNRSINHHLRMRRRIWRTRHPRKFTERIIQKHITLTRENPVNIQIFIKRTKITYKRIRHNLCVINDLRHIRLGIAKTNSQIVLTFSDTIENQPIYYFFYTFMHIHKNTIYSRINNKIENNWKTLLSFSCI